MIISKTKLILDKTLVIQKDFLFDKEEHAFRTPFLAVKSCFGDVEITKYRDFIRISANLEVIAILECSYTLEPFDYGSTIHEDILISENAVGEEEAIVLPGDDIELEKILFGLISSNLPIKPIKPGASLPKSGEGYHVIDDVSLAKDRALSGDLRFAKLDEIDLETDDD